MSWGKDVSPWRRRVGEKMCPHEEDKTKEKMWPKGENGPRNNSLGRKWLGEMILPWQECDPYELRRVIWKGEHG